MLVAPEIRDFLDKLKEANLAPVQTLAPAQARAQMEAMAAARVSAPTEVAKIESMNARGPRGEIPMRIYRARNASEPQPLLVYYHGGGHVIGSLDTHDSTARSLCAGSTCVVASIDYRMGPEHKFPAAVDDCLAATRWLVENAGTVGIDPKRVAVGGDSAGGNLAAVVALAARDAGDLPICFQLLVYPVADYRCVGDSYERFASGYGVLEADTMRWFRDHYLNGPDDALDWRASPLAAGNFESLPPALVITAQCDVLHDEGVAYAQALAKSGNVVEHIEASGMVHGFFGLAPLINGAVVAQSQAVQALRRAFE